MHQIINESALREDILEGIANYLDIEISEVEDMNIKDIEFEYILDKMFETESEYIAELAGRLTVIT